MICLEMEHGLRRKGKARSFLTVCCVSKKCHFPSPEQLNCDYSRAFCFSSFVWRRFGKGAVLCRQSLELCRLTEGEKKGSNGLVAARGRMLL